MNKVKYYHVSDTGLSEGASLGRITVVLAADYDTALSKLAALREELAAEKKWYDAEIDQVTKRLADAERRNSALVELLRKVQPCISTYTNGAKSPLRAEIDAALTKPEEAK